MIFRVLDYQHIPVILTDRTWSAKILHPLFGHPEVKSFLADMQRIIKEPDAVYQSIRDTRSKLFFHKIQSGEFASYFLVIVIKYVREQETVIGYVSTIMVNKRLPKASQLIWQRKISI